MTTPIAASAPTVRSARHAADQQRGEHAPQAGADEVRGAHHRRDRRAAEHGVRQAVPDVAHRAQHHVHADQPAQRAGDDGDRRRPRSKKPYRNGSNGSNARRLTPTCPAGGRGGRGRRARARPACRRAGAPASARRTCARARTGAAPRSGGPSATTVRLKHTMRGRCAARPLMSWVVSTIVVPSWCRSASRCSISWRVATSTPPAGSSSTSTSGSCTSARARNTRCCWPPLSAPIGRRCSSPMPSRSSTSPTRRRDRSGLAGRAANAAGRSSSPPTSCTVTGKFQSTTSTCGT